MHNTLRGTIVRIVPPGAFTTYIVKLETGETGVTYISTKYRNFALWSSLRVGDNVSGLVWKNHAKKILDADHCVTE